MGKLLIIVILMLTAVFATIIVAVQDKSTDIPELISSNISEIKARSLSNEALMYSIKKLNDGSLSVSGSELTQTFSEFNVLDGTIDSIKYVKVGAGDTLQITSYVTANVNGKEVKCQGFAKILYSAGGNFGNAVTCSGVLNLVGNPNINGQLENNVDLNFENYFGMTMTQMKAIADNYYLNPPTNITPISGITYVELTGNNTLKMVGDWSGEGILIVDGNFETFGNSRFEGIVWIEGGSFYMRGNSWVDGTMFINSDPNQQTEMFGNCWFSYDEGIVQQLLSTYNISSGPTINIINWIN